MNNISEIEKAYFAGLFDGEGSISIAKYQGKNNRTPVFLLSVVITQSNQDFLQLWQTRFAIGSIYEHTKRFNNPKWSKYFDWRLTSVNALVLLEVLLPYLILKREEANIAIEFQKIKSSTRHGGKGYTTPQEITDKREILYKRIHDLKGLSGKRGRPKKQISCF